LTSIGFHSNTLSQRELGVPYGDYDIGDEHDYDNDNEHRFAE